MADDKILTPAERTARIKALRELMEWDEERRLEFRNRELIDGEPSAEVVAAHQSLINSPTNYEWYEIITIRDTNKRDNARCDFRLPNGEVGQVVVPREAFVAGDPEHPTFVQVVRIPAGHIMPYNPDNIINDLPGWNVPNPDDPNAEPLVFHTRVIADEFRLGHKASVTSDELAVWDAADTFRKNADKRRQALAAAKTAVSNAEAVEYDKMIAAAASGKVGLSAERRAALWASVGLELIEDTVGA